MRKTRKSMIAFLAAAALLAGCGSSQTAAPETSQTTAEAAENAAENIEAAQKETGAAQEKTGEAAKAALSAFDDVAEDYWAKEQIDGLAAEGWIDGEGSFRPEDTVTRGEYIQMLAAAFPAKYMMSAGAYSDVAEGSEIYDAVSMSGAYLTTEDAFEPEKYVTREEAVSAIMRAIGYVVRDMDVPFADQEEISENNQVYVAFAADMGLVESGSEVNFNPGAEITRAEAAVLIYDAATYKGDSERPSGNVAENVTSKANASEDGTLKDGAPVVYMTTDLSSDGLMKIYEALDWQPTGKVGVKMSTGEAGGEYYLHPDFIADLVHEVDGTIIECNTAYGGSRAATALHRQTIEDHGFNEIAEVDIMDEEGYIELPTPEGSVHLDKDMVGSHLENYDSILVLSHFKGHAMGGFGGALKNISIGIASQNGKMYIHSGGRQDEYFTAGPQNDFLESMAEAAGAVMQDKEGRMVYISVMNNLSVDCDCDGNPEEPDMHDIGILASYDPVALDRACVDLVYAAPDSAKLVQRIESRNGTLILDHAEELGMGSQTYELVSIDEQ